MAEFPCCPKCAAEAVLETYKEECAGGWRREVDGVKGTRTWSESKPPPGFELAIRRVMAYGRDSDGLSAVMEASVSFRDPETGAVMLVIQTDEGGNTSLFQQGIGGRPIVIPRTKAGELWDVVATVVPPDGGTARCLVDLGRVPGWEVR